MPGAGAPPETLRGDGLLLRSWRQSDLADLQAAVDANRSHLSRWLVWAGDESPGAIATFLRDAIAGWSSGSGSRTGSGPRGRSGRFSAAQA